ncbi:MAG: zinc ribbon domain-containing protein [Elusimicrobiota bacterium]
MSNIISDTCILCGSRLEKICGDCGFSNEVEKNYCDQCGVLLTLKAMRPVEAGDNMVRPAPPHDKTVAPKANPKFQFEMQPIQDTVAEKEASFRNRPPSNNPAAPVLAPTAPQVPVIAGPPKTDKLQLTSRISFSSRKIYGALMIAGLLAVLSFLLWLIAAPHMSKFSLKMAANNYLKKLSTGRYEEAYAMLSTNSKSACSMKDYVDYSKQYYDNVPAWKFSDVAVFVMEAEAAMVRYQLRVGTEPWRTDYISFVKEHNNWTRPYIWMLFDPIDTAIAKQNYPQALFLAQKLYLTDPMDPRSFGYLCASEFFMGLYDEAVDSCRKTVVSAATYPVGFTAEELFWFKFYHADSLRFVRKLELALDAYAELLKSGIGSARDQCNLLLSRADTYVKLKKYDSALDDMLKADSVCTDEPNRAEVVRRMRFMNGEARADAILFAQQTRSRADLPPFGELRRKALDSTAARLGPKNMRYMPKDNWVAAHLSGPEYRVVLWQEGLNPSTRQKDVKSVYAFMVNLWTGVIIRLEEDARPQRKAAARQRE